MSINLFVCIVCIFSIIIGAFIGIKCVKFYNRKQDKKILQNAKEVLAGGKENKILIDGQEFKATKFRLKDNNGKEILIDLEGGGEVQDVESKNQESKRKEVRHSSSSRQDSSSDGEKKRTSGIRSIISRIRRFG
jgi:hypothetical protein